MISIRNLKIRLGDFSFGPIDLNVNDGEYMVILGPTGCGKTVLLETLAGIHPPRQGKIEFHGRDVTELPPEKRDVGFVYQRSMLFPHLPVRSNILYGLRYRKATREDRHQRLQELAELLGIEYLLHRSTDGLSGGESQKVALARALAIKPSVLFFDEPLGPLDQSSKESLRIELKQLHRKLPTTTLHVTHDRDTAVFLADRIGVLSRGHLEQVGTPDELFNHPETEFVARFLGTENIFHGPARPNGDGSIITLGCGEVHTTGSQTGDAAACIHGNRITILPAPTAAPQANQIEGTVESILAERTATIATVQTACETFTIRHQAGESVPPVGTRVWLAFMPQHVHLARPSQ